VNEAEWERETENFGNKTNSIKIVEKFSQQLKFNTK
jgi:hypothetical protein